jgi:hypothetical protein
VRCKPGAPHQVLADDFDAFERRTSRREPQPFAHAPVRVARHDLDLLISQTSVLFVSCGKLLCEFRDVLDHPTILHRLEHSACANEVQDLLPTGRIAVLQRSRNIFTKRDRLKLSPQSLRKEAQVASVSPVVGQNSIAALESTAIVPVIEPAHDRGVVGTGS